MSGQLPIDRVREAQDAPRIYEDHRQRYSEKQAKLRDIGTIPPDADTDEVASAREDDTDA